MTKQYNTQDSQSELREEFESIAAQLGKEPSYAETLLAKIEVYVTTRVKEAEQELASRLYVGNGDGHIFVRFPEAQIGLKRYIDSLTTTTNGKGE